MASLEPDVKRQRTDDVPEEEAMQVDQPSTSLAGVKVQDLMKKYYGQVFPHEHMYKWLAYGNDGKHAQANAGFFQKREFCFTLDGDIFVRYQSFKDGADMREAIKNRAPSKIDIGPVYSANPQERLKFGAAFQPVERELVFDIDLTDYDDVRTCGSGGHICTKCWPLMAVAVAIIDRGLREDFGFKNILWVYSGRRGIHCWVCDPSARKLTDEQRSSIASYFAVYKGHENDRARLAIGGGTMLHPAVQSAVDVLTAAWEKVILPQQALLEDPDMCAKVLKYLPDEGVQEAVRRGWADGQVPRGSEKLPRSVQRWRLLLAEVGRRAAEARADKAGGGAARARRLDRSVEEIVLAFSYPRLDMEVSKKMNHLLKAPFCVHPKTGKVCVPIDPAAAYDFDPETVCTVHHLLEQIANQKLPSGTSNLWEHTDLADSVRLFQTQLLDGCSRSNQEELNARVATARESAAAMMSW